MAISIQSSFTPTKAVPIDTRILLTKAEMLAINDNKQPDYYFAICKDDGQIYLYNKSATPNSVTGKFSKLEINSSYGTAVITVTSNNATVIEATFKTMITKTGIYTFIGTKVDNVWTWRLNDAIINLNDYGITYTGTATSTDRIVIDFIDEHTLVA